LLQPIGSGLEFSFQQEHLLNHTDRILIPAAGIMLANLSVLDVLKSFKRLKPVGSIIWGEGLNSALRFSEFQLNSEQVAQDSSIGIYWKEGQPINQLAVNTPNGNRKEIAISEYTPEVIKFLASHYHLTPELMNMAHQMGNNLIGEQLVGPVVNSLRVNMVGAGMQFALHKGAVKVLIEGFYGDKKNMEDEQGNINIETAQLKRRLKLRQLLPRIISARSEF
jgi:hypothetical protein